MNTITIDCGASFIKSTLFVDGEIKKRLDIDTPFEKKENDIFYTGKIEDIIRGVNKIIESFSLEGKKYNLCISNEMHGFLLADEKGGPCTGYISWQKEYGNIKVDGLSSVDILKKDYSEEIRKSGMNLRAGLPSSNLYYIIRTQDFKKEKLYFYTLGEYIIKRIFNADIEISVSNAAASGLYDLSINNWNQRLISLFNEKVVFPEIGNNKLVVEKNNKIFNIFPAIGDYQAALLGAGIEKKGDLSFNLGTGAQVSIISEEIKFTDYYQVLPFFGAKYLYRIPHLPSGRALNVYFRFVKDILNSYKINIDDNEIWDILNESIYEAKPNEMKCSMSFFENPIDNRTKGFLDDIGEYDLTLGNLFKLIFDKEADNFLYAADKIANIDEVKRIIFSGGIARRILYIKNKIINHYGDDVEIIETIDETMIGLYKYSLMC